MKKQIGRIALACVSVAMLSACNGPFADYDNYDLKIEYQKCRSGNFSAAGEQRCSNIRKECEARKADTGFRC